MRSISLLGVVAWFWYHFAVFFVWYIERVKSSYEFIGCVVNITLFSAAQFISLLLVVDKLNLSSWYVKAKVKKTHMGDTEDDDR